MISTPDRDQALTRLRAAHAGYLRSCGKKPNGNPFYSASVPGWVLHPADDDVASVDLVAVLRNWADRAASAWLYDVKLIYARWLLGLGMLESAPDAEMVTARTTLRITPAGIAVLDKAGGHVEGE